MIDPARPAFRRLAGAALLLVLLGACGILESTREAPPAFYSLDLAPATAGPARQAVAPSAAAPTLIVNPPHATAGYDSRRIIYSREAHQLEYFAHSEWADTPARMLAPLIVAALENTGAFRAVVLTPSAAAGDLRLNVEIRRLQHEFAAAPSRVRFTLRAYLVDIATRQVIAQREFDASVAAPQADPYGGVVAANAAVQNVMSRLADFCADAARNWQTAAVPRQKGGESTAAGR